MDKKYYAVMFISLAWIGLRTKAYFQADSNQDVGAISGMVFAENRGYQRGVKIHLIKEGTTEDEIYPASYSGSFKIDDVQKGTYRLRFTKHGFSTIEKTIMVKKGEVTEISPITLTYKRNSDYFYHLVHFLNVIATAFLLTTGIGICGFSFGGIVASIATAHDSRLKAAGLCLSEAEPDKVIFAGLATQPIKEAFIQHGISQEQLQFYFKPINPLSYVDRMSHAKVLLVNTPFDTNFLLETQKAFYEGFRKNKVESYLRLIPFPCGHYGAGKYLFPKLYLLNSILCFFKKEL